MDSRRGGSGGGSWRQLFGFDRRAGLDELHPFDNDPITGLEAVGHEPLVADGALRLQRAQLDLVVGIDDNAVGSPFWLWVTASCGTSKASVRRPSSICSCTNMPGSSNLSGFGKRARSVTEPLVWSTGHFRELQLAGQGIATAVLEEQMHLGLTGPVAISWPAASSRLSRSSTALGCVTST